MGFFKDFFSQTKKSEGFLGKMMVSSMNSGHAPMAAWVQALQVQVQFLLLPVSACDFFSSGQEQNFCIYFRVRL